MKAIVVLGGYMTKADTIFKDYIRKIMEEGVWSEQARPKYKDGRTANSKYITGAFMEFDLAKGEFPITTLRPIAIKSAIKEMLWIYQDQSNSLDLLEDKYNVHYWNDWEVGDSRTIGQRYGAVVKKHDITNKILKQLEANPWNRRNIISLWDYDAFEETDGLLPCAFQTMFDVRRVDGEIYLDATLTQRSNDMLVAHHINAMQYVALQMMIAKHFGWKVGKFFYFINNLHIYDNQFEQAEELLRREPSDCQPHLVLNVPDGTNFFDIKPEDFELVDYDPVKPQLKFDLAI
jgi:thymidylate synthase